MVDETPEDRKALADAKKMASFIDMKRWQVKFASGQGQQVTAASEADARAEMVRVYGPEYAIESVTEITAKPVK